METIQIDFDVYKALTSRRATAQVTYNDVIRDLLGLPGDGARAAGPSRPDKPDKGAWMSKGVTFPAGTQFRARHKGRVYEAEVRDGALVYNGERFTSPSPAATAVTGTNVNGWKFWECRFPGSSSWVLIFTLWKQNHRE